MTSGSLQDRRQLAQNQLDAMSSQSSAEHPATMRAIASQMLGFTQSDAIIAVNHEQLPETATVVGTLAHDYGPHCLAVHFDLSARHQSGQRNYVTLAQMQAANDIAQRYAGSERYPLLIFILPDNSGVQCVTGNPVPDNHFRLQDVARVTAWWGNRNRIALDCLESVGGAIARGAVPPRAFNDAFNAQPLTEAFFKDYKAAYDDAVSLISASLHRAEAEQFTQTLFNRLLFVHFVSRKGWLKVNGDADYLNALWSDYGSGLGDRNFYADRLQILFFDGLNNARSKDVTKGLETIIGEVSLPQRRAV